MQDETLDEMAKGGEASRGECGRGGGANGKTDAFEDGCLAALWDTIVLDSGLEVSEEGEFLVDSS